jgi:hypothetical protein
MGFNEIINRIRIICTPFLVFVGVILNLLTIMVFCRRRMRKYCLSLSMISLAIADTAILTIPVLLTWIDEFFYQNYFLNNTYWCNFHGYADLVLCANSSWIIILISSERWFAVCKPWIKSRLFTNKRVAITLVCILLTSLVSFIYFPLSLHVEPIANVQSKSHIQSEKSEQQAITYECKIHLNRIYTIFGSLSVLIVYVVPFITLALLNTMIIMRLRLRPFSISSVSRKKLNISSSSNAASLIATSACNMMCSGSGVSATTNAAATVLAVTSTAAGTNTNSEATTSIITDPSGQVIIQ